MLTIGLRCAPETCADSQDDGHQRGTCCDRILQQLESGVVRAEVLRRDAGANNGDQQQGGTDELGEEAPRQAAE